MILLNLILRFSIFESTLWLDLGMCYFGRNDELIRFLQIAANQNRNPIFLFRYYYYSTSSSHFQTFDLSLYSQFVSARYDFHQEQSNIVDKYKEILLK